MISITSNLYQAIFSLVIDITFVKYIWLIHSLTASHFKSSNAYNFLICEQKKHQVSETIHVTYVT